ncbi:MAG TPA: VCBS repeat-containing protein [Verrucomicrobiota bacterium]|nr:cysteine protease [Verrucomicrobiales bacterium]HRI13541.1 VCBS repeat-containing protein [Verrucomicrobiota bacterium]
MHFPCYGRLRLALGILAIAFPALHAATPAIISFKKQQLSDQFWAEGANVGDFNKDGVLDVVSGPYWWAGPDFQKRQQYAPADAAFELKLGPITTVKVPGFEGVLGTNNAYSKNFLAFSGDINRDGWDDILILGFPGEKSSWYENPKGGTALWAEHVAIDVTDNESPTFLDLTGDGIPEIVCASKGSYGYATPDPKQPTEPWTWHAITPNNNYHKFTHGMGVGDVNGDGRMDLLEKDGWWEQPVSLAGDPVWTLHRWPFGVGGAQMFAYDVNGDGLNDVITSLSAHGYGLAWFEQYREGNEIKFKEHTFMNKEPSENRYGVKFSQLHAVDLIDVDGDGLKDIVTGKRFWAHGPAGDPEPGATPVLYWFRLVRNPDHSVDFVPYRVDDASGVGTQVVARDINGDRAPDLIVGNKRGVFVFTQQRKPATAEEWKNAQPTPLQP